MIKEENFIKHIEKMPFEYIRDWIECLNDKLWKDGFDYED